MLLDFKYAIRSLARSGGFALAVIVTLGLGLFPGPVLDWLTVPIPMLS